MCQTQCKVFMSQHFTWRLLLSPHYLYSFHQAMPSLLSRHHKTSFVKFLQGTRVLCNVTAFALLIIPMAVNTGLSTDCIAIQQHSHISNDLLIHRLPLWLMYTDPPKISQSPLWFSANPSIMTNFSTPWYCICTPQTLLHHLAALASRILLHLQMSPQRIPLQF